MEAVNAEAVVLTKPNFSKFELNDTAWLHLRDGDDELMYAEGADGEPDKSKPVRVELYGPGTKQYRKVKAAEYNRQVERLQRGKSKASESDLLQEKIDMCVACTKSFDNFPYTDASGPDLFRAIYAHEPFVFIADQVVLFVNQTKNFTKGSAKS